MRMLVGNDPRAYREVIAGAVQGLRPDVEVIVVEPEDLDMEVIRLEPDLVICSHISPAIDSVSNCWIMLYPAGATEAVISVAGKQDSFRDLPFDRLLLLVDEAREITGVDRSA